MPRSRTKTPLTIEFGRRVRERRRDKLMTQEQLAERAGVDVTWLSSLENGQRNPSMLNIVRLAEHLDLDPGQLMAGLRSDETSTT